MQEVAIAAQAESMNRVLRIRQHPSSQALLSLVVSVWSLLRHTLLSITAAICYHLLLIHTWVRHSERSQSSSSSSAVAAASTSATDTSTPSNPSTPRTPCATAPSISTVSRRPAARHLEVPKIHTGPSSHSSFLYHPFLLPPICPTHFGKLTVVLDLDETLICTYKAEAVPDWLCDDPDAHFFTVQYGKPGMPGSRVVVYERPGLREFLLALSEFCELVLFTAGLSSYAQPLADYIDPEGKLFSGMLFREATCSSQRRDHVKDLGRLGRDPGRMVLVDNNPYSFLLQPANGVPCLPFHGDTQDSQLMQVSGAEHVLTS
jgi:Dullard-like phosphatase family protein